MTIDECKSHVPDRVRQLIEHELSLIERLKFEAYFLTVHDLVTFARSRGILCQGRGSAANSAVCYCLGVTCVDPARIDVLFERFISAARGEPPDIDIDFEHERREEVLQYTYEKYGRERAGMTAEIIRLPRPIRRPRRWQGARSFGRHGGPARRQTRLVAPRRHQRRAASRMWPRPGRPHRPPGHQHHRPDPRLPAPPSPSTSAA